MAIRSCEKLAPRFFGPYSVLDKIGQVAYRIALPERAKIHPVFHVSQLKQHVGSAVVHTELPVMDDDGLIAKTPARILARRMTKHKNHAVTEVLVQWSNGDQNDATWELLPHLQQQYPHFDP